MLRADFVCMTMYAQEDDGEDVLPALPKSKAKLKGHLASLFSTDSDDDGSQANANLSVTSTLPITVDAPHSVESEGAFMGRGVSQLRC